MKKGKADYKLDLPASVFGTLEIHAYQTLATGEIIRDSRVVYVNPAADLKIDVRADKDTYLPGEKGTIRFEVTDSAGKPAAAALGVLIVDEAVYALQEMQPGLEKVFFTLQEELLKPQAQAVYKPQRHARRPRARAGLCPTLSSKLAQVLLAADPARNRRCTGRSIPSPSGQRKMEEQVAAIGNALWHYAQSGKPVWFRTSRPRRGASGLDVLDEWLRRRLLDAKPLDRSGRRQADPGRR